MKGKLLDAKMENAELRAKSCTTPSSFSRIAIHREMQSYLEPMMKSLGQALDHTVGLSKTLTQSMQFATALERQTATSNSPLKRSPCTETTPKQSVAQILPMIKGHCISQPKIRMTRVRNSDVDVETARSPSSATETSESSPPLMVRQRQRRLRMRNVQARESIAMNISDVVEDDEEVHEEDDDEEEEIASENTVLLIPRLVLDRVTINSESPDLQPSRRKRRQSLVSFQGDTPKKLPKVILKDDALKIMSKLNQRKKDCDREPIPDWRFDSLQEEDSPVRPQHCAESSPVKREEESPVRNVEKSPVKSKIRNKSARNERRESNEEFIERVMAVDPMEGPSWLFDDNGKKRRAPPKPAKVKEKSDESGDTRRSRRRAAAAAVGSLKEPSTGKKLRQGDPTSSSIYPDYVPQTKPKRSSSIGNVVNNGSNNSLNKKRSK